MKLSHYLEGAQQCLIHAHHCTSIIEFTAVVGCGEEGHEMSLREKFIPILHNLGSGMYMLEW